ncbi:terminase small subunit [Enterococcus italicus]|nr:terminase small subunit [Enterococcus italicus]
MECFNATQAALKAGYSKRTAEVAGSKLLRNAKVINAIIISLRLIA